VKTVLFPVDLPCGHKTVVTCSTSRRLTGKGAGKQNDLEWPKCMMTVKKVWKILASFFEKVNDWWELSVAFQRGSTLHDTFIDTSWTRTFADRSHGNHGSGETLLSVSSAGTRQEGTNAQRRVKLSIKKQRVNFSRVLSLLSVNQP